ncbi:MAG: ABC transporter C-terminal domain-containing protein [Dysosmobacter sp.]
MNHRRRSGGAGTADQDCEEAQQAACGSDYVKLQDLQAKQAELEAALEEKTERWMYLKELKEKIDAQ